MKLVLKSAIGWLAVVFIIWAYALMTLDAIDAKGFWYNFLNLLGGAGLAWRVWQDRNYSNFFLEVIFMLIAVLGIIKSFL